ncbi:GEVED domain-containing protein [Luteibaculum oceani]|uniref:T9SS type A sorting domain-containing protein n=1 Tax=Luteibaculum oceani TaxID=1294296 RepID=A0A5C6V9X2_9FLAO|nr:GEVED domain-containing protein [Luteibaculum oceani]TXC81997.1 T9SS type A sorting domain-containing protein [Luteibaculum oceani]
MNNLFALVFTCMAISAIGQDILSYRDSVIPMDFIDMNGGLPTEVIAAAGEDEVYPLAIPFTFKFFNNEYQTLFASINGNVTFGSNYQGRDFNREKLCYPVEDLYDPAREQDAANPDNFIAVYWDDLFLDGLCVPTDGGTPKLAYRTVGTAPNREFIVTWDYFVLSADLVPCEAFPDYNGYVRAQLKLHETTNNIEIIVFYNNLSEIGGTVGVENEDASYANFVECGLKNDPFTGAWLFMPSTEDDPGNQPPTGGGDGYCAADGGPCDDNRFGTITEFTYGTITTTERGCEKNMDPSDTAYGDNTDIILPYQIGTPVNFSGRINSPLGDQAAVWIDWDQNQVFESDEMVLNTTTINADFSGTIEDPRGDFKVGLTRLRVRTYGLIFAETPNPCGTTGDGETEDYSFFISDPSQPFPDCPAKISPADDARDICQSTSLIWGKPANVVADSFQVKIFENGSLVNTFFTQDTTYAPVNGWAVGANIGWTINAYADDISSANCDTSYFDVVPFADPNVQITPVGDTIFTCKSSNQPLNGVMGYPSNINHVWSGPAAAFLNSTNAATVVYNNPAETSLKLYYSATNDFGCGGQDSVVITTLDGAVLEDYYLTESEICQDDTVFAVVKGAIGNLVFEDSVAGRSYVTFSPEKINDTLYQLPFWDATRFVRLRVELGDCDVQRDSIRLTINPAPERPIVQFVNGIGEACQGGTVGMEITNFRAGMFWNDANSTSSAQLFTSGSGEFFASYTENGCTARSEVLNAQVHPNPQPEIFKFPNAACQGDSLELSVVVGFSSVKWNTGKADSLDRAIIVFQDGNYQVNVVDTNGCEGSNSEQVTFFAKASKPVVTQLDPDPACAGTAVRLVASYDVAGRWNTGATSDTLVVTNSGSFTYKSITNEGCETQADEVIEVTFFEQGQKSKITVKPEAPYCSGDSVLLISQFADGNLWSNGATNDSIYVKQSGMYAVRSTDNNGCEVESERVAIQFGAIPTKPSITVSGNVLTCDSIGEVYEWFRDGIPLNKNQRTITAVKSGNYTVKTYNKFGCGSVKSDPVPVTVVSVESYLVEQVSVYPNPSNTGYFHISNAEQLNLDFELFTIDGKAIDFTSFNKETGFQVPSKGHFLLKIRSNNKVRILKIVSL